MKGATMSNTKRALDTEHEWIKKYNNEPEFRKKVNEALSVDCERASKCLHSEVTEFWSTETGKSGREVPKSDFVLDDKVGVSFKSGKGRATSANYKETRAIFLSTLSSDTKYSEDKDLASIVEKMFEVWSLAQKNLVTDKDTTTRNLKKGLCEHAELSEYINTSSEINELISTLKEKYSRFVTDVIKECLTGQSKFGDRPQRATHYIRHNDKNIDKIDFAAHTESQEFLRECEKYKSSFNTAMKSSSGGKETRTHWIRFM